MKYVNGFVKGWDLVSFVYLLGSQFNRVDLFIIGVVYLGLRAWWKFQLN